MDRSRGRASEWSAKASDKFSNLKDKITGSRNRDDGGYDDGYDDYGYDDGYGDEYGEGYDAYEDTYGQYSYDAYEDAGTGEVSTRGGSSSSSHPRLVSIDDVRANTQVPDRLRRDPLPDRGGRRSSDGAGSAPAYGGYSSAVDATSSFKPAPTGARSQNLRGRDALFDSTTDNMPAGTGRSSSYQTSNAGAAASYDPYATYEGTGAATHTPTRTLKVISPLSYGEVESVARSLKAGDAVVLSLRRTPSELSKRVLDFSFGVASALDARVDCVADKVFVVSRGSSLTAEERVKLQGQGIL